MTKTDENGRVQLGPEDVGDTDREKRGYTKSDDAGADPSGVATTLDYRIWFEGEVLVKADPLELRLQYDLLGDVAERLGFLCKRQFIPAGEDPKYFPRRPTKTSPRRYTMHEFVIYLIHYPGVTIEDMARGMFPETQQTKSLIPRVRQMMYKMEKEHRVRVEKCRVTGKWRYYPPTSKSISGTVLSRSVAQAIGGAIGAKPEDILQAVDTSLKKIAANPDLLGFPDNPAWRSIMDPAELPPGAEEPLVVSSPSTGLIPDGTPLEQTARRVMPGSQDLTVEEIEAIQKKRKPVDVAEVAAAWERDRPGEKPF